MTKLLPLIALLCTGANPPCNPNANPIGFGGYLSIPLSSHVRPGDSFTMFLGAASFGNCNLEVEGAGCLVNGDWKPDENFVEVEANTMLFNGGILVTIPEGTKPQVFPLSVHFDRIATPPSPNGVFQIEDANMPLDVQVTCDSDSNRDGLVDVEDLLNVLIQWGACE